jgi:chromosome segregation ATPase
LNSSLEPARRNLATAARALDEFRRLSGAEAPTEVPLPNWRVPAETGARAALDEARVRLAELGAELDKVRRAAADAADAAVSERLEASRAVEEAAALRARSAALEAEWTAAREVFEADSAAAREGLKAAEARARRAEDDARESAAAWTARLELLEREALSTARAEASRELASTKARAAALEADLEAARGTSAALEAEARSLREAAENRAASRSDSRSNAEVAQRRAAAAESRVSLLEAECVRLQSMRRTAEQAAADAEAQGRAVAETLRGELRAVHASLDRAAVEAGGAEARTRTEVEPLLKRLEAAAARVQTLEREKRLEAARGTGESSAIQTELLRAQAVSASLRQELSGARAEEDALRRRAAEAQAALKQIVADRPAELERALAAAQDAQARLSSAATGLLSAQAAESMLRQELSAARGEEDALRRQVAEARAALERAVADRPAELARALASAQAAQAKIDALQKELLSTQEATAAASQELSRARGDAAREEEAFHRRSAVAQAAFERILAKRTVELKKASDAALITPDHLEALKLELKNAQEVAVSLRRELADVRTAAAQAAQSLPPALTPPAESESAPEAAPSSEESDESFVSPSLELVLDPGWARLLRLVRPPIDSAYAHLRRMSGTTLTAGQKTLLRMAAASIAQASDSLSSIELALAEGPAPGAPAPVAPVLEASLNAWEAAFRGRGVALAREISKTLPEAPHDPKELRIALQHVLRNVLEAVPRGGRLTLRAGRGSDGALRLEFSDDGPGFPAEWLERRFEAFAAPRRGRAGLGLSIVRRTLRRWGGDAEASNAPTGHGARLTLIFAPPPPPELPAK